MTDVIQLIKGRNVWHMLQGWNLRVLRECEVIQLQKDKCYLIPFTWDTESCHMSKIGWWFSGAGERRNGESCLDEYRISIIGDEEVLGIHAWQLLCQVIVPSTCCRTLYRCPVQWKLEKRGGRQRVRMCRRLLCWHCPSVICSHDRRSCHPLGICLQDTACSAALLLAFLSLGFGQNMESGGEPTCTGSGQGRHMPQRWGRPTC